MQHRSLDGNPRSGTRGGAARAIRSTATGAALTMTTLLSLFAMTSVGCGDDDVVQPPAGGTGGTAGRGGNGGGGTGGGGTGGTAGTAGGGTGGVAGTAGTAGTGGTGGGNGGTGGDPGDAGVTDGGDGGPQLSVREQQLVVYCDKLEEVPNCEPLDDCVALNVAQYDFFENTDGYQACLDEVDAYYACVGPAPVSEFECAGSPPVPQYTIGSPTCADVEAAFYEGLGDPATCVD